MTTDESYLIERAASLTRRSQSRFLVSAALLIAELGTEEELRAALSLGDRLAEARLLAVIQLRFAANQVKLLRTELKRAGRLDQEQFDKVLGAADAALARLGEAWGGPSAK